MTQPLDQVRQGFQPLIPPNQTDESPNCMNRLVQWFRSDETSTVLKVGAAVLAILVFVGVEIIGALAGYPILTSTLAGLVAVVLANWARNEWSAIDDQKKALREKILAALQAWDTSP